jgi:hypothetical protein
VNYNYKMQAAMKERLLDLADRQGRSGNDILDEILAAYLEKTQPENTPEAELKAKHRRLQRELGEHQDHLDEYRKQGMTEGTKDYRYDKVARTLDNNYGRLGPMGQKWHVLRYQACQDLEKHPAWAEELRITERDIRETCSRMEELKHNRIEIKKLKVEIHVLEKQMAEAEAGTDSIPQDEPATTSQEEKPTTELAVSEVAAPVTATA